MRVWFARLRTIAALLAALFLLVKFPLAYEMIAGSSKNPAAADPKTTSILRVWLCDEWSGTGLQWLMKQSAAYEKANKGVRIVIRKVQADHWQTDGIVLPDIFLFENGAVATPAIFSQQALPLHIKEFLQDSGKWGAENVAVPLYYSAPIRLYNPQAQENKVCIMHTEQDYQNFASGNISVLVGGIREVRRFAALCANGKGFEYTAEPYNAHADRMVLGGVIAENKERSPHLHNFLTHLLSFEAQNSLAEFGLLSASKNSVEPDRNTYPILYALNISSETAVNAFD